MKTILLTLCNLALICGIAYKAYEHGNYVGRMETMANSQALQEAGYTSPFYIDNTKPAVYLGE